MFSIIRIVNSIQAMHNALRVASKRGWYRRSHRLVAFYLRSPRNIALTKIHFKYFLGIYSLEKELKIANNINLGLSHRPCFDTRFQVPSANEALCIACIISINLEVDSTTIWATEISSVGGVSISLTGTTHTTLLP